MVYCTFILCIPVLSALAAATTGARAREAPAGTTADFVGRWSVEYIHDPDDPENDLINYSFDLDLYRNPTSPDSLYGWHCSSVRGGRRIDCAAKESGDAPSIRGLLRGDTVYVRFESGWEVAGNAKLYFTDPERRALVWELGEYAPDREHYIPRRDTLYAATDTRAPSMTARGTVIDDYDAAPMACAMVRVEGTDRVAFTDAGGRYTVSASPGEKLVFNCIGYETEERIVSKTGGRIDVALSLPDVYGYNPIDVAIDRRCLDIEADARAREPETTVVALDDSLSVRVRRITREEYDARRQASVHLRHEPYNVVTDSGGAKRMLRGRAEFVAPAAGTDEYGDIEITYNDGTRRRLGIISGSFEENFATWYPDLDVAVFISEDESDVAVDFADSRKDRWQTGNPAYHAASPDGRRRVNGWYDNAAGWTVYFVERRNGARFDFAGYVAGGVGESPHLSTRGWVWTDNDTVIFEDEYRKLFYEMTIIENNPRP